MHQTNKRQNVSTHHLNGSPRTTPFSCQIMNNIGYLCLCSKSSNRLPCKIIKLRDIGEKHNPNYVLLQETHLDQRKPLKISNYIIIRNSYANNNIVTVFRGTTICFRNSFNVVLITPPLHSNMSTLSELPSSHIAQLPPQNILRKSTSSCTGCLQAASRMQNDIIRSSSGKKNVRFTAS